MCVVTGLAKLENFYGVINKKGLSIAVDPVRLCDVNHSYMTLRQIDARRTHGNKYIVLDLSNDDAILSVLKQASVYSMSLSFVRLDASWAVYDDSIQHSRSFSPMTQQLNRALV